MTKRDEWIRVRSESELRAGMCVEIRPCKSCGATHRFILLSREPTSSGCQGATGHRACRGFFISPVIHGEEDVLCGKPASIPEGRLYRLFDSQLTEDETTRELERVR